jgi:hypothetical protein
VVALRFRWISLGLTLFTSVAWAQASVTELRKPAPDSQAQPYRERLEALIRARYPELLTQKVSGTPVVTILFDGEGTPERTDLRVIANLPGALTASEEDFARFGLTVGELKYIGVARVTLPLNAALVIFGAHDSRSVDYGLVQRFFPEALKQPGVTGTLWILLDHEGRVLKTGQEQTAAADLFRVLHRRYPAIQVSETAVTTVFGPEGHPIQRSSQEALQLNSFWLAVGSPLPEEK